MVTKRELDAKNGNRQPTHKDELNEKIRATKVEREGSKIIVPLDLPLEAAVEALKLKIAEQDKVVDLSFDFDMTVPEGALALFRTLDDLYGFVKMIGVPGFFGDEPPMIINIETGKNQIEQIPWGKFGVPGIEGYLLTDVSWKNKIPFFSLAARVPGKHKQEIQTIVDHMRARHDSVYKGKAITVNFPAMEKKPSFQDFFPKFMDLAPLTVNDLIFSADVQDLVDVALFTPLTTTEFCREHQISLKRGILLEGPYGVGKTLTATVTANLAEQNGWTFIHMKNVEDLPRVYAFAAKHQPAVIFCEDLDEVLEDEEGRDAKINGILNSVDGIESKGVELITVFTTNKVENITQAMLRPGRIDTVVPVRPPDAGAVQRLVRHFAKDKLAATENLAEVGRLLAGKNAAVVREVVERSTLSAVRRQKVKGEALAITARDIEVSARGMEAHNKLLEPKPEDTREPIERGLDNLAAGVLEAARTLATPLLGASSNGAAHHTLDEPFAARALPASAPTSSSPPAE